MNASLEHQRILLSLADLDRRMRALEIARTRPPEGDRINELSRVRQQQLQELAVLIGARDDARAELQRIASDVVVVEQRRARDAQRLASTTDAKQAQAFERELASLARRLSELEDAQLEAMARVEETEKAAAAQQALADLTQAEGAQLTGQARASMAAAAEELTRLTAERAALRSPLAADLLALFDRVGSAGPAAAPLRAGICEGCRIALPRTDLSVIRAAPAQTVATCPECGCILVRDDEAAADVD